MSQREEAVGEEVEVPTGSGWEDIENVFSALTGVDVPPTTAAGVGEKKGSEGVPATHGASYGSAARVSGGPGAVFPQFNFVPRPMQTRIISIDSILFQADLQVITVRAAGLPGYGTRVYAGQTAVITTDIVFSSAECSWESVSRTANHFVLTISPLSSNSPHFCEFLTYCCAIGGTIDLAKMLSGAAGLNSQRLAIDVFNGSQTRDAFIPADASLAVLEIHQHKY
jgi:hypothetical protein